MKIETTDAPVETIEADAVAVGVWKDEPLEGPAKQLDDATGGALSKMIELDEVSADRYQTTTFLAPAGVKAPITLVVGLGEKGNLDPSFSIRIGGVIGKSLAGKARSHVAVYVAVPKVDELVSGLLNGCVGQDLYLEKKKLHPFESISIWQSDSVSDDAIQQGTVLGESVRLTRHLVNLPASDLYPESFAHQIVATGDESGFEVEVWDEDRLERERCGALLAVGRASTRESRLVIMRYNGGEEGEAPIGLVGKGVTFDSGGLSLKPSSGMLDMKCDMAGAATVVGAMKAIAELGIKQNVFGFVGLAENMIAGDSFRLGDVLTARSGKTIEVHNTDAEGRLVLADTLDVAIENGVDRIVDLATLTGACVVALGMDIAAVMTNDDDWADQVVSAANECGEAVWPLPMFPEFSEQIKSPIADIKNVGDGRWGGAITAGKFLEEFVQGVPWVHLDIAGPSFADKPKKWIDGGASGCMVRSLVRLVEKL
jgi:leucyl aminopeptidase